MQKLINYEVRSPNIGSLQRVNSGFAMFSQVTDSDIFIHVGAVWVPICKRELHDARPPEPGHASDHYRFLRWTKSESGCQATTIPWKVELAAVVFFARQLTLSNSCPPLVMESIYELSAGRETCLGCTPLPSYFNTKMENFLLHANLD